MTLGAGEGERVFGWYVVADLNAIRPPMTGKCETAFFLGEDYLSKGTNEGTRVNVNIGRMSSYPTVTSVPLNKIHMGSAGPLPFVNEQNDHELGLNGSLPSLFLQA